MRPLQVSDYEQDYRGTSTITTRIRSRSEKRWGTSVFDEIGAFAFGTGIGHFHRDAAGEAFDLTADEATPAEGFHLLELGDDLEGVIGAFADEVEDRPESL